MYCNVNKNIIGLILLSPLFGLNDQVEKYTSNNCLVKLLSFFTYILPHCKMPFTKRNNKKDTISITEYTDALDNCKYKLNLPK